MSLSCAGLHLKKKHGRMFIVNFVSQTTNIIFFLKSDKKKYPTLGAKLQTPFGLEGSTSELQLDIVPKFIAIGPLINKWPNS